LSIRLFTSSTTNRHDPAFQGPERLRINVAAAGLVDVEFVPDVLVRGVWLGTRRGDE